MNIQPHWIRILCCSPLVLLTALGLFLTSPQLLTTCLGGHDIYHHLIFSYHFSEQLLQGELYPRWLTHMNGGFGSPTFFFYPPLPYYLTALFSWIPEHNLLGCTPLGLSISLALILSGMSAYYWLRELTTTRYALGLAMLYMVLPYHLLIDLYVRFSFAEFWSFAWMPLILYCSKRVSRDEPHGVVGLGISLALLITTHLPTFLIFLPILVGYSLVACGSIPRLTACARNGLGIVRDDPGPYPYSHPLMDCFRLRCQRATMHWPSRWRRYPKSWPVAGSAPAPCC